MRWFFAAIAKRMFLLDTIIVKVESSAYLGLCRIATIEQSPPCDKEQRYAHSVIRDDYMRTIA